MFGLSSDIGVDLGTASVLVYVKGKGIVLREPSVVAINKDTGRIIAVGEEARRMLGRTPGNIVATRPLREGVIADYDVTEKMLRYFINKANGKKWFFRPRVMVCIPSGVTGVEERAVRQATIQAGGRTAHLIEEPLAAALGAGIDISEPSGSMVVDIGGGTSDVAVLSLGGIVVSRSIRVGGDKFDEAIVRYIRKEFSLMIGERTGEEIKVEIATAHPQRTGERVMQIRGRDLITGLPKAVTVSSHQIYNAIEEPLEAVVGAVKEVLEVTPPELAADIVNKGIVMTGGGALLNGMDTLLSEETGLPVYVADDAISCIALGTGKALAMMNVLPKQKSSKLFKKVMG
ncbi:rod shape-determining protein [Desulforamulus ruminis]|uniref:Cell shape-determining protein MreB n=1 Tax=Desulforamulus ruminis (strain ATCC 23193 / DSM 2154 / NCIMB 8452 / DL) TaxID=696281 RepID=F6DP53_DESRL|nr:rod shape-determining protein [Desulforamulus ruminis]AEG61882.1 cell shape determining protein, MreB/Mrl family [Desulforamulus ruminis DSM 2154]